MHTEHSELFRMLIGGLVGILSTGGWGALALGLIGGIFGRRPNPVWIVLGLTVFMSGPVVLGFANKARWSRILLAGLLSPVVALIFAGGLFASLGILEWSITTLPFNTAPIIVAVYVAVLIGMAELLTRQFARTRIMHILRSVGLAVLIVFGFELLSNILPAIPIKSISESGWGTWLVIILYAILVGVNVAYFSTPRLSRERLSSNLAAITCSGLNLLVLIIVVVVRLFM